ncbi:coiled-coil domain-containing protein 160 homolog [Myxocyprinus asiaticus]|uniref:coiled-coil domain-containing protein 160 homolog n=1 Tax=Myxocyprinus asiaticus TaxID=70543 RepID=UPI0022216175|nr:coiled-coil domain-containing protein 160 homolog [Myxocyprinus asiaticus]
MEIAQENTTTTQGSAPSSRDDDDDHWVEKLFPPHFTFQNLLENKKHTSSSIKPWSAHSKDMDETHNGHRRQIYLTALKEVQHSQRLRKTEALAKTIIRQEQCEGATPENHTDHNPLNSERADERLNCIWNEMDITKLRTGFAEMERDIQHLKQQLRCTEEQLKAESEQKRRLEEELSLSRKKAARQTLVINELKTESQKMNVQLHNLTIQVKEKAGDADRWGTTLRKAKEDMQKIEQERSNLAWELERVQAQQKTEGDRLKKAARIENEAALLRVQRELEQAQVELCAERESHARSRAALVLLRRHFNSQ